MPQPWMTHAACRGVPVNTFFPAKGESANDARAICDTCPALAACHDFAVSADAPLDGILAGLTARQRASLRAELHRGAGPKEPAPKPRRRRGAGPVLLGPFPKISAAAVTTGWTRQALIAARRDSS